VKENIYFINEENEKQEIKRDKGKEKKI